METKICCTCKKEKFLSEYHRNKKSKDGRLQTCIACNQEKGFLFRNELILQDGIYIKRSESIVFKKQKKKAKDTYMSTSEGQNKENERHRLYYQKNKDKWKTESYKKKQKERCVKQRLEYPDKVKEKSRKNNAKRRLFKRDEINEKKRISSKKRKQEVPVLKLIDAVGARVRRVFKSANVKKTTKTLMLLGCSSDYFQQYIQSQFTQGMTMQNHGKGEGKWHLDHIIPCALFNLNDIEQQKICFNWGNYQPLWEKDNLSKNSFFEGVRYNFKR